MNDARPFWETVFSFPLSRLARQGLSTALVVPFAALILAAGLGAGYIAHRNGAEAALALGKRLRHETLSRIQEHLSQFLATPQQILRLNAAGLATGRLDAANVSALQSHFLEEVRAYDSVTSISFGNTAGGLANAGREGAAGSFYVISTEDFAAGRFEKYSSDDFGRPAKLIASLPNFDARSRPWYSSSVSKGDATWSDIYVLFTETGLALAPSRPVFDAHGDLLGVVSIDLFLSHISKFLREAQGDLPATTYIVERSGLLVASSSEEQPLRTGPKTGDPSRLPADQSVAEAISLSALYVQDQLGGFQNIERPLSLSADLGGIPYFLEIAPIQDPYGIDWVTVVTLPENAVLGPLYAARRWTGVMILGVTSAAVLIALGAAWWLARPIRQITVAAEALARGDWSPKPIKGRYVEAEALAKAFGTMRMNLQEAFRAQQEHMAELAEAELRFRHLAENLPVVLWVRDADTGEVQFVNGRYEDIWGRPCDELYRDSKSWRAAIVGEDRERVSQAADTQYRLGTYDQEYRLRRPDGQIRWVHSRAFPVRSPTGDVSRIAGIVVDVTERKAAETALRESEEKYRIIFENEIYAICIFDLETLRLLDINQAYERLYGYTRDELLAGMTIHEITAESEESDRATKQAVKEGTIFLPLRFHRKKDGTVFPVEIVGGPYTWQGRRVMFALAHDISERRNAEERLQELLRERETILNSAPVGISLIKQRRVVWANSMHQRMFGYGQDEISGLETAGFYTDATTEERVDSEASTTLAAGETYRTELTLRRRDETTFWAAMSGRAIDPSRPQEGVIWVLQDLSEHHRTRALLQTILDSAPVAIGWANPAGTIVYVNARYEEQLGYCLSDVPTLDTWFERAYPDPDYREEMLQSWEQLYLEAEALGRSGFGPMEAWVTCASGERKCFALHGAILPEAHVAIFSDITERKEAERALSEYAKTQHALLREVNHRVKNNLAAIIGLIHLGEDHCSPTAGEEITSLLHSLEGRVRALADVHSLLSTSEWRPLDLKELCEYIIAQVVPGVSLARHFHVEGAPVLVDARQAHNLALLLNELATNSIKHAKPGHDVHVRIQVRTGDGSIELDYRDDGPGFPPEVLSGSPGADRVGLAVIRGIVCQSLRGKLELANKNGARVKISFPRTENEAADVRW